MKAWSKRFALVFFLGFIGLAAALGYGGMAGAPFSDNRLLVALRFLSLGLMASGLALWIALLREEAGKPGVNPLLGFLLLAGLIILGLRFLYPSSNWTQYFDWGGLALTVGALVIGALAMFVSPAYPKPMTSRWPEGGENQDNHSTKAESH